MNLQTNKHEQIVLELRQKCEVHKCEMVRGFRPTDLLRGFGFGIFLAAIFMWIPIIGWVAAPVSLVVGPFLGTWHRKKYHEKQLVKIKKKLDLLSD